jgi:hypothetical protein
LVVAVAGTGGFFGWLVLVAVFVAVVMVVGPVVGPARRRRPGLAPDG